MRPLTSILIQIFTRGFYTVHAGMFLFTFLVLFGMVEPGQLISYHISLMLAFITSPLMLIAVFSLWLLYTVKSWHYVLSQINLPTQQFLFYSSTAFGKKEQIVSWFTVQFLIQLPVIGYGFIAASTAIVYHHYLVGVIIISYLFLLTLISAYLYTAIVNQLKKGNKQSILITLSGKWRKPFFSLFIYHLCDKLKLMYLIAKVLSWIIITVVFNLFADVSHDMRVAGIAVLGIITAHTVIIFETQRFRETWLSFARNLPYTYLQIFMSFAIMYLILLLPEAVWLFNRFSPLMALTLLAMGLSTALLFNSLLYKLGLNMDRFLQWIMGLFVLLFWVIMFKFPILFIIANLMAAFMIFYKNYYRSFSIMNQADSKS